jgi:hypothetical protein
MRAKRKTGSLRRRPNTIGRPLVVPWIPAVRSVRSIVDASRKDIMKIVPWICAAAASALALSGANAGGVGLTTDVDRVPWASFQSRIGAAPGAPGWHAELAPLERSGLQVGSVGLLGDVYFGAARPDPGMPVTGFRATSGILIGARSPLFGQAGTADRRLFGSSAPAPGASPEPTLDSATLPYVGIGYNNLWAKSGWSFSADLGVVSQSPGSVVRFGRVFGGSQGLDDVIRDMRLAPVVQLGVSYSF